MTLIVGVLVGATGMYFFKEYVDLAISYLKEKTED